MFDNVVRRCLYAGTMGLESRWDDNGDVIVLQESCYDNKVDTYNCEWIESNTGKSHQTIIDIRTEVFAIFRIARYIGYHLSFAPPMRLFHRSINPIKKQIIYTRS